MEDEQTDSVFTARIFLEKAGKGQASNQRHTAGLLLPFRQGPASVGQLLQKLGGFEVA